MTASLSRGSTIGILGGGQLGRMMAAAAARLGYRCIGFAPEGDNVAGLVGLCAGRLHLLGQASNHLPNEVAGNGYDAFA